MIVLLWGILIVLVLILVLAGVTVFFFCSPKANPAVIVQEPEGIKELTQMLKDMKEDEEKERVDQELIEYAKHKRKDIPSPMRSSIDQSDRPVRINRKNADLIPYGLSEAEKKLLEEFGNGI